VDTSIILCLLILRQNIFATSLSNIRPSRSDQVSNSMLCLLVGSIALALSVTELVFQLLGPYSDSVVVLLFAIDGDYRVYVSKNSTINEALEDVKTIIDRNQCSISISYSANKWHSLRWETFYLSVEQ
jgi:hypothetical protein